jgi:DNA-binding GntR family transcriptional regulator
VNVKTLGEIMSRASDHAYAQIRRMILEGVLAPGVQIREEALAESCGVSRTPVRDALRRLEAEAFVQRNDTQRVFVSDWSLDDIEEAFHIRAMLEGRAAARAAERIGWAQTERLRVHNIAIDRAIAGDQPDVPAFLEHNRQFHAIIIEAAASRRLAAMLAQVVEQPVVQRTALNYDRENLARSHHEHGELLSAFDRRDAQWAQSIMQSHIRRAFHAYADAQRKAQAEPAEPLAA